MHIKVTRDFIGYKATFTPPLRFPEKRVETPNLIINGGCSPIFTRTGVRWLRFETKSIRIYNDGYQEFKKWLPEVIKKYAIKE